jgi:hypothetical protein
MKTKQQRILGLDLGNTIVKPGKDGVMTAVFPDAVETIRRLKASHFGDRVYIISKVNEAQRLRAEAFLRESSFLADVGIPREQVLFCAERRDKAPLAAAIGITDFVDDRPEVLAHMDGRVSKRIAYDPNPADMALHQAQLRGVLIAKNWLNIAEMFML